MIVYAAVAEQNSREHNVSKVYIEILFSRIPATDFNGCRVSCLPDAST